MNYGYFSMGNRRISQTHSNLLRSYLSSVALDLQHPLILAPPRPIYLEISWVPPPLRRVDLHLPSPTHPSTISYPVPPHKPHRQHPPSSRKKKTLPLPTIDVLCPPTILSSPCHFKLPHPATNEGRKTASCLNNRRPNQQRTSTHMFS